MEAILYVFFVGIPSAVFYGLIFLLVRYLPLGRVEGRQGTYLAIFLIAAAAFVLPIYGNQATERHFRTARALDTLPPRPIALSGDIRVNDQGAYGKVCDYICRALLLTPGVASVTDEFTANEAYTYRLSSSEGCREALAAREVRQGPSALRTKQNECVIAGPRPARFDFQFTQTKGTYPLGSQRTGQGELETRLQPRSFFIDRTEILDHNGKILLRSTSADMRLVRQPLMIIWTLERHPPHIGFWAKRQWSPQPKYWPPVNVRALLNRHTTMTIQRGD